MTGELRIEMTDVPQGLIVRVSGDASVTTVERLHKELGALSVSPPRLVVLDLSGLEFIASLGMGAILAFDRRVAHAGGHVRLAALRPIVLDAFRRARLIQAFQVRETVEDALKPVDQGPH